jgi:transcriptional regulator with XRE-family HTH domain
MATSDHEGAGSTETIGHRIRRLRQQRGLSLRDLATAGVSFTYLSRLENETRTPSIQVIRALARQLRVSPEYLETGKELSTREQLELALADAELKIRLDPLDLEVEEVLREVFEEADRSAETDLAAKARAALGMASFNSGRLAEAIAALEAAIADPVMTPEVAPDVYMTLARAYKEKGDLESARVICTHALDSTHADNRALRIVFATNLSNLLADLGDTDAAASVLGDVETDLEDADPYARSRHHWSLARLAASEDNRRLALRHMHAAIEILNTTEDTERVARAHVMSAEILLWGGVTVGVDKHLRTARTLMPPHAGADSRGVLRGLEAILDARETRYEEAMRAADESLDLLREHVAEQVRPVYAIALASAGLGDFARADASFDRVVRFMIGDSLWREAAMIARERAAALEAAGEEARAAAVRREAEELDERAAAQRVRGSGAPA